MFTRSRRWNFTSALSCFRRSDFVTVTERIIRAAEIPYRKVSVLQKLLSYKNLVSPIRSRHKTLVLSRASRENSVAIERRDERRENLTLQQFRAGLSLPLSSFLFRFGIVSLAVSRAPDESKVESSQTRDLTMPRRRPAFLDNGNSARSLPRKERTLSGKQDGGELPVTFVT